MPKNLNLIKVLTLNFYDKNFQFFIKCIILQEILLFITFVDIVMINLIEFNIDMANNPSAKKRIKINKRNKIQNRYYKTSVRTLIKTFFKTLEVSQVSNDKQHQEELKKLLNSIYSLLDKGTKKKIFHKNMAARQKSRLATYLKSY